MSDQPIEITHVACPNCGQGIPIGQIYCEGCGIGEPSSKPTKRVSVFYKPRPTKSEEESDSLVEDIQPTTNPVPNQATWACTNCGLPIPYGTRYCANCGAGSRDSFPLQAPTGNNTIYIVAAFMACPLGVCGSCIPQPVGLMSLILGVIGFIVGVVMLMQRGNR